METLDTVVIGAGVVGLAAARALALRGREVWVLERADMIGTGISSRNSEVIHAGLYHPADSLKARWCVKGRELLYDHLSSRGISHLRCGKLVVATEPDEVQNLSSLWVKARANGVHDLRWLEADEAQRMEPALRCVAALHSPSTGILDSHGLMLSLQADIENAGGQVVCHAGVRGLRTEGGLIHLEMHDGLRLQAHRVVNAAGLAAVSLAAATAGMPAGVVPQAHFAKGNYFTLAGRVPFKHLIYPVPAEAASLAGLGVHLTLDLAGQARFGPDVQWVESMDDGMVDVARAATFHAAVRRYWPELPEDALQPGYVGIRPKISGPGEPTADFMVLGPDEHGLPGQIHLLGIESPGLTSCLALGEAVATYLLDGAGPFTA